MDQPTEIPGVVLEPGTYVIKLVETKGMRNAVHVLTEDESRVIAKLTALADHRMRPEGDVIFTHYQFGPNGAKAIQSWFYPGDLSGLELVFPKQRAIELARATDTHVMAASGDSIVAITPIGKEVVIDGPSVVAPENSRQKPKGPGRNRAL